MTQSISAALRAQLPEALGVFAEDLARVGVTGVHAEGNSVALDFADHVTRARGWDSLRPTVRGWELTISGPVAGSRTYAESVARTVQTLDGVGNVEILAVPTGPVLHGRPVMKPSSIIVHTDRPQTSRRLAELLPDRWGEDTEAPVTYLASSGERLVAENLGRRPL